MNFGSHDIFSQREHQFLVLVIETSMLIKCKVLYEFGLWLPHFKTLLQFSGDFEN